MRRWDNFELRSKKILLITLISFCILTNGCGHQSIDYGAETKDIISTNAQHNDNNEDITNNNFIDLLQDSKIKEIIGSEWELDVGKVISFINGSNYCIVLARQGSGFDKQCKMTILKYNQTNFGWVQLDSSSELIIKDHVGTSINILEKPNIDLVAVQLANGGSAGYEELLFFSVTDQGVVQKLDNRDYCEDMSFISNVKVENNMIIADGFGSAGRHEISFDGKQIQDHKTPLSQMGNQIKNAIIVRFQLLNDGSIILINGLTLDTEVGNSIVFIPQDDKTKKAFDSGTIGIYSKGGGIPLAPPML